MSKSNFRRETRVEPVIEAPPVWIRGRALAERWGCSISQAHRLAARNQIRRFVPGGTGKKGPDAANAMVLYSMEDVLTVERAATVTTTRP